MKKKIFYNITSSLMMEVVSVICAFILPRMIISDFGSEYNGMVSSITQFLSVVTLLRSGVGGVTKAALYKPLAENDTYKLSIIVKSTERFMRRIVFIFIAFLLIFASLYPLLVSNEFGWLFTFSLVLILGISTVSQYYFGITYQFLLSADQRSYVYNILQTVATILNVIFSVILINMGVEFRLMKLISAIVFAAIPIALYLYTHKKYTIIKDVPRDDTCINQRWDAFAHQIAAFVHSNTDLMVLTVFSNLYQVSVYNIYYMVVSGVRKFVTVFTSGIEAVIGKMIATSKSKQLNSFVSTYELGINVISIISFTCTALLIVPFMQVYTAGVTDVDYIQPMLGYFLVLGSFLACVRLPYQSMVESAGHFKETRNGAILEAVINVTLSLILVNIWGAVGVAIGTVFAMAFRTIQYAIYSYRKILRKSPWLLLKRFGISIINILIIIVPYFVFGVDEILKNNTVGYLSWILEAFVLFVIVTLISFIINVVFYRKEFINIIRFLVKRKNTSKVNENE